MFIHSSFVYLYWIFETGEKYIIAYFHLLTYSKQGNNDDELPPYSPCNSYATTQLYMMLLIILGHWYPGLYSNPLKRILMFTLQIVFIVVSLLKNSQR